MILRDIEIYKAVETGTNVRDVAEQFNLGEQRIKIVWHRVKRIASAIAIEKELFPDGWQQLSVKNADLSVPTTAILHGMGIERMEEAFDVLQSSDDERFDELNGRRLAELQDWFIWNDQFWDSHEAINASNTPSPLGEDMEP